MVLISSSLQREETKDKYKSHSHSVQGTYYDGGFRTSHYSNEQQHNVRRNNHYHPYHVPSYRNQHLHQMRRSPNKSYRPQQYCTQLRPHRTHAEIVRGFFKYEIMPLTGIKDVIFENRDIFGRFCIGTSYPTSEIEIILSKLENLWRYSNGYIYVKTDTDTRIRLYAIASGGYSQLDPMRSADIIKDSPFFS